MVVWPEYTPGPQLVRRAWQGACSRVRPCPVPPCLRTSPVCPLLTPQALLPACRRRHRPSRQCRLDGRGQLRRHRHRPFARGRRATVGSRGHRVGCGSCCWWPRRSRRWAGAAAAFRWLPRRRSARGLPARGSPARGRSQRRRDRQLELAAQPLAELDDLPEYVGEAFLAVEDKRFREHDGVDWRRVGGAAGGQRQGRRRARGLEHRDDAARAQPFLSERMAAAARRFGRKLLEARTAAASKAPTARTRSSSSTSTTSTSAAAPAASRPPRSTTSASRRPN
jgi:hypothetical protein